MGIFGLFQKKQVNPEDVDYMSAAAEFEKNGDFVSAIDEYQKIITYVYPGKEPVKYNHVTKKIIECYIKLNDYDKVMELWPLKYNPADYGAKEMYELIKILEVVPRIDLVMKVYDKAGKKLLRNKIEFLVKQKKIPEANALMSELLISVEESNPAIMGLWLEKAKLSLSLRKWEEACKYLNKIIERDAHNPEARKLKEFCLKQVRGS